MQGPVHSHDYEDKNTINLDCIEAEKVALLIATFNDLFQISENTILVSGTDEPLYVPAKDSDEKHHIIFAHGFFASALHELSHWLVAGKERRKLEDYGYWYKPDGRTKLEQIAFEQVEIKPQALEWILSAACAHTFHFSADNLNGDSAISDEFKENVRRQAIGYIKEAPSIRMQQLVTRLSCAFNQPYPQVKTFRHLSSC
jgi:elongation factor P hydroxylase